MNRSRFWIIARKWHMTFPEVQNTKEETISERFSLFDVVISKDLCQFQWKIKAITRGSSISLSLVQASCHKIKQLNIWLFLRQLPYHATFWVYCFPTFLSHVISHKRRKHKSFLSPIKKFRGWFLWILQTMSKNTDTFFHDISCMECWFCLDERFYVYSLTNRFLLSHAWSIVGVEFEFTVCHRFCPCKVATHGLQSIWSAFW